MKRNGRNVVYVMDIFMTMDWEIFCSLKKNQTINKGNVICAGKTKNIVQMKETGQYICENACDESDEEEEEGGFPP